MKARLVLSVVVMVVALSAVIGTVSADDPRYNADDFSVAAFPFAENYIEVWGNCDEDDQCQLLSYIFPLKLTAKTPNAAIEQTNVGWVNRAVYLGLNEDGEAVYQINTFDSTGRLRDNEMEIVLHKDGAWSLHKEGGDAIFTGNIPEEDE